MTWPDEATLQTQLRAALDPTVGFVIDRNTRTVTVKKSTAWTAPQISTAQTTIDNAPAQTPQSVAQAEIDAWSISQKALVLALIDKINDIDANLATLLAAVNVLNTKTSTAQTTLPNPTAPVTPAQALQAIRNKAGTL